MNKLFQLITSLILLCAGSKEEESPVNNRQLINFNDCSYIYAKSITINVFNITEPKYQLIETQDIHLNSNDTTISVNHLESNCFNGTQEAGKLSVTLTNTNGTELELTLIISTKGLKDYWSLDANSTVTAKILLTNENVTFPLISKQIAAEQSFGYSCGHLTIYSKPVNQTKGGERLQLSLGFRRFQIQPFVNPRNRDSNQRKIVFTDSFDCEVWMTFPLWMGLFALIIMFIILSMGIYFIAIVNTPDRFENPKGKPLIISTVED